MERKFTKFFAVLLSVILCFSLLTACSQEDDKKPQEPDAEQTESLVNQSDSEIDPNKTHTAVSSVGSFTTQDISGSTVTQDIFKEHELTMVNVFATWCSPCVAEMPDLEKLHQLVKDKNVGVIGIVLDVLNEKGEIVDEDLQRAQELVKKTGVTYPVLIPDTSYMNGRLIGIDSIPETFFVDKNGNIVSEEYVGSAGLEDWSEVVEEELAALKGDA